MQRSIMTWVRDPHAGGATITAALKGATPQRLMAHAQKHHTGRYLKLDLRFRGAFCYIDAHIEPAKKGRESYPMHLCRLRHCGQGQWSVAFFAYSSEKYEPCALPSGSFFGSPEEGFDVGAVYLQG
jgi:hypothetical protein